MSEQIKPLFHLAKHKDGNHRGSLRLRWFIKYGDSMTDFGFSTKSEALEWVRRHWLLNAVDWQSKYIFRLKGDTKDISIVNKDGYSLKTFSCV
jgi:hypothetical protein